MAITEDASTPAPFAGGGTGNLFCPNFSPPAGSLLIALCGAGNGSATTSISVTDSTGGTWTLAGQAQGASPHFGCAAVYYRYLTTAPGSMNVTASFTNLGGGRYLAVRVLTGVSPTQNSATHGGSVITSASNPTATVNTTASGSYLYGIAVDNGANDTLSAPSGAVTLIDNFQDSGDACAVGSVRTAACTATPGSQAIGVANGAHGGLVAYMEVLPATTSAPIQRTWTTGEVVTDAEMTSNIQGPINWLLGAPRTAITSTSGLTVASGAVPSLITTWNQAVVDYSNAMWDPNNPGILVNHTAGRYELSLYLHYPYSANAGMYHVGINLNGNGTWNASGTRIAEDTRTGSVNSALGTSLEITTNQYLNAGDYVAFYTAQTTSGSLTVPGNLFSMQASARWIASS